MANDKREQRINQLAADNPDVPREVIEKVVDGTASLVNKEANAEAKQMEVNSILGTLDPMYT